MCTARGSARLAEHKVSASASQALLPLGDYSCPRPDISAPDAFGLPPTRTRTTAKGVTFGGCRPKGEVRIIDLGGQNLPFEASGIVLSVDLSDYWHCSRRPLAAGADVVSVQSRSCNWWHRSWHLNQVG